LGCFGFLVEKSTGSFCGGDAALRTMVSSPLLTVVAAAAALANGHLVTRSRPRVGRLTGASRKPGAGLAGAYGWKRPLSFFRAGSS
jgi:hypothetical protein